ncbi:hemin uptake protein HemP [Hoeflea sp. IMCC20628]|nr:hemin uptake protein HemP [Hoeflea sp. IMCC20628]
MAPNPDGPAEAIASSTLFGSRREITISHEGSLYRLRITRQGKLILNK